MAFDTEALLRQVFPGMDELALQGMVRLAKVCTYPADTLLCREGAEEEIFYILGEGQVLVTQQLGDEERFLRYSGPGQYFGEMALIANSPRNANVRTTTETSVLEIDKTTFIEMIRQNPVIALTMFRTSVGWLRSNDTAAIAALSQQKQEIERAYDILKTQERQRSEFLTTLAHELRTPITTANGYMQLIKKGTMTGPALEMGLEKVSGGLERIVSLVNDLLFVQEMDLLELVVYPLNLKDILSSVVEEAAERAGASNLTIVSHLPNGLLQVEADPDGLRRALLALLDNAIKFSPGGGTIHIEVSQSEDAVDIAFADPGVGIDPEFLPRIFDRFEHQEKRGDYLFGGIGLGLAIAQHLIEGFGGSISVESEVDRGSIFTVHLPMMSETETSSIPESTDDLA